MKAMEEQKFQRGFFFILLGAAFLLALAVFLPFLSEILLAAIGAVVLHPIYARILQWVRHKESIAALFVLILVFVCILTPLTFLGLNIFHEAQGLYSHLQGNSEDFLTSVVTAIEEPIRAYLPDFSINLQSFFSKALNWLTGNIQSLVFGTANTILSFVLFAIALFYLLKDGERFINFIFGLSPLEKQDNEAIRKRVRVMMNAVVRGVLVIAIIQGFLAGIGFTLFGIPNPTLWGTVAAFAALLPGIGTALVFIPAILYLAIAGSIGQTIGIALWGLVIVGLVDNFLAPFFYGRGTKIHPLAILFSVLGGIAVFGPIGFLIGPIAIGLFFAILDIYRSLILGKGSPTISE